MSQVPDGSKVVFRCPTLSIALFPFVPKIINKSTSSTFSGFPLDRVPFLAASLCLWATRPPQYHQPCGPLAQNCVDVLHGRGPANLYCSSHS